MTERLFKRSSEERERGDVTRQKKSNGGILENLFYVEGEFPHKPCQPIFEVVILGR